MANVDLTQEELQRALDVIKNMHANGGRGNTPSKVLISPEMIKSMSRLLGAGDNMNKKHTMEVDFDGDNN